MADKTTKDLDFDELHKAVNALMDKAQKGGKSKASKPATQPTVVDTDVPVVLDKPKDEPKVERELPEDNNVKVTVKRPLPNVTLHGGSHGRAMDVISPRSSRPEIAPPSVSAKREAPTLQPTTRDIKPEPAAPVAAEQRDALSLKQPGSPDLNEALASLDMEDAPTLKTDNAPTMTHQKNEWPDPLDMHDDAAKPEPAEESVAPEPTQTAEPAKDESPTMQKDEAEPDVPETSSPFLTTKVEKRPLGAYSDAPAEQDISRVDPQTESAEPNVGNPVPPQSDKDAPNPLSQQAQPEELSPEVVAVESSEPEFSPEGISEDDVTQSADLRSMSIPSQYRDDPDKADEDKQRPVFDTKEYHPAIEAHVGSHKHSAAGSWVMAIILLIVLIALLGAAYYFITGGLDFSSLF